MFLFAWARSPHILLNRIFSTLTEIHCAHNLAHWLINNYNRPERNIKFKSNPIIYQINTNRFRFLLFEWVLFVLLVSVCLFSRSMSTFFHFKWAHKEMVVFFDEIYNHQTWPKKKNHIENQLKKTWSSKKRRR